MAANGLFLYHVLGLASCVALVYFTVGGDVDLHLHVARFAPPSRPFVERRGAQLFLDGRAFYVNGWNSYWLMDQAVEEPTRPRVARMFRVAAQMGLTVCRTWAFSDGGYNALQLSPGRFDERVFKALDRVIVEAGRHGIRLVLSLANNLEAYGGKTQYVRWAWEEGVGLSASNDSFFFDPSIRDYFKVYLKTLLTRKNHLSGIQYKDDPTILAWELMNEPRCTSDPSGDTLQHWIEEMARYVKSIDQRHLLTVGTEGFYGPTSSPEKLNVNPGNWFNSYGSDFIRNSNVSHIDFASVHLYPDNWLLNANLEEKLEFVRKWATSHIEDGDRDLKKPVLITEFGLSHMVEGFDHSHRDVFYKTIFDTVYESARRGCAGAGAFIWQLAVEGMEVFHDGFAIVPGERPSLYRLMKEQSCRLATLRYGEEVARRVFKTVCDD